MAHLHVRLTPRSARNAIERREGDVLHVRVTAPPVNNAANEALIALLARALGVARSSITLRSGAAGRNKVLEVAGVETDAVWRRLGV